MRKIVLICAIITLLSAGCGSLSQEPVNNNLVLDKTPVAQNPATSLPQNPTKPVIKSLLPFSCKDLVPDLDVRKIIGDDSVVPVWADTGAIQDFSGNIRITCTMPNQKFSSGDLTADQVNFALVVINNIDDYKKMLNPTSKNDEVLKGLGYQALQTYDGTGLGEVDFISTNKKYFVASGVRFSITKQAVSQVENEKFLKEKASARAKASEDLAKIIDQNLNKY